MKMNSRQRNGMESLLIHHFNLTAFLILFFLIICQSQVLSASCNEADTTKDAVTCLEEKIALLSAQKKYEEPVGTLVLSILNPSQFVGNLQGPDKKKWILADGSDVIGSKFASLFSSKVPDMRGYFLRGMNHNGGVDPDIRAIGVPQLDKIKEHKHRVSTRTADTGQGGSKLPYTSGGDSGEWWSETQPDGAHETRPKNMSVYIYIKID